MSLQDSLTLLHRTIKKFQNIVKSRIFNLGKFKITIIKPNNKTEKITLTLGLYFLRNSIKELMTSKIKLKDFTILQKTIKIFFQKFIDTYELINFDKGGNLFIKLNKNPSISLFKLLFCDFFQEKIKIEVFNDDCNDLKESLNNFDRFKEKYRKFHSKFQYFESLRAKFERYQTILNSGNLKLIKQESLEDFRLFRSFYPLTLNSEYVIDIKNKSIVKL
ncbi:MAG: hypothetical protein EU535_02915 [Promethearchaeota archaeon]|nr:MAG: hypothetical protein EU535_02915 [Candidatus Lokiarchaeota archaeon]